MSPTSYQTAPSRDMILLNMLFKKSMAEEEGFEPPRGHPPAGFQDQSLQPDLGIPPEIKKLIIKKIGGPGRIRTCDLPVMSREL